MASTEYLSGRIKFYRPQAMIWSNKPFTLVDGGYIPSENMDEGIDFIVITDHNRGALSMSPTRIESRSRMINGTSRAYHTADKYSISADWTMLPSRIAQQPVTFDQLTGKMSAGDCTYIADDASAARDMIDWYNTHIGEFYVYLSYDLGSERQDSLVKYVDQRLMFFDSFNSVINKRGIYDMWDINVGLGEV